MRTIRSHTSYAHASKAMSESFQKGARGIPTSVESRAHSPPRKNVLVVLSLIGIGIRRNCVNKKKTQADGPSPYTDLQLHESSQSGRIPQVSGYIRFRESGKQFIASTRIRKKKHQCQSKSVFNPQTNRPNEINPKKSDE